ncbi:MAG: regulatory protein RecX [Lachnospiraceae bacterium]|nr:regulatory protein RecX [Lachnospiraceae bacterium]MEE0861416.1 regulatory protein RecX [Lachnospiraceae bacterium]
MEEYRVLSVVLLNKKKFKVLLEGTSNVTIALYPSELRRYNIQEGNFLSKEQYKSIEDILYKRGKERALYYLKNSDKTSYQMRNKLREGFYPENIIEKIIDFLSKYGYIDDLQYAIRYITYNINKKSYIKIKEHLRVKGIDRDIVENAFADVDEYSDSGSNNVAQKELIRKHIRKKINPEMDIQMENKIVMSVVRKGFMFDDVVSVLKEEKNTRFSV